MLFRSTSTGGYDSFNVPFFNVDDYGASTRTGERFLYDGHTSSNLNIGPPLTQLPPSTSWGHFHENMPEICLMSGAMSAPRSQVRAWCMGNMAI